MKTTSSALVLVSLFSWGCGGAASSAVDAGPASPADGSDAAPCNDLDLRPGRITVEVGTGSLPEAGGGAITDGTYVLTSSADFNADDGIVGQPTAAVMVFSDGTVASVVAGGKGGIDRVNATYILSGTSITETGICGLAQNVTVGYTATATTLTLIQSAPPITSTFIRISP